MRNILPLLFPPKQPTMTTQSTDLAGTIVQLDALYTAYQELLLSAKQQLEQFEFTPQQMDALKDKVKGDSAFVTSLKDKLLSALKYDLIRDLRRAPEEQSNLFKSIVESITQRVVSRIEDATLTEVTQKIMDIASGDDVAKAIQNKVEENFAVNNAFTAQAAVDQMINYLYDHQSDKNRNRIRAYEASVETLENNE